MWNFYVFMCFQDNPFAPRICRVFSQADNANMTLGDFIYMMSVLSDKAPRDVKAMYAFKLYGKGRATWSLINAA